MAQKKDRTLPPNLERTIVALRLAGVPERNTYESIRRNVKNPPSYRDIRAAYERAALKTRHDATVRRRSGEFVQTGESKPIKKTHYREKLKEMRTSGAIPPEGMKRARQRLDDTFLLGYGYRAGLNSEDLSDEVFADRMENVELGEGS